MIKALFIVLCCHIEQELELGSLVPLYFYLLIEVLKIFMYVICFFII